MLHEPELGWPRGDWPRIEPSRKPSKPRPRASHWCLVVAVYDDVEGGSTTLELYDAFTGASYGEATSFYDCWTHGLAGSPTKGVFYALDPFSIRNSGGCTLTNAEEVGGEYEPLLRPGSLVNWSKDGNLYVLGGSEGEVAVLRYHAACGKPNGSGPNPCASPLYLELNGIADGGLGLFEDENGDGYLAIPQFQGVTVCPLTEGGKPVSPEKRMISFSSFGLSLPNGVCGPSQGPDGLLYFLYFGEDSMDGVGVFSISPEELLSHSIDPNIVVDVEGANVKDSLPFCGHGVFTVGPTAPGSAEAVVYYLAGDRDSYGDPTWSVIAIGSDGSVRKLTGPHPGVASAICLQQF